MSRFFAASSSGSDSDSDSDNSLSSDSQFQSDSELSSLSSQSEKGPKLGGKGGKWLKRDNSDSDSDGGSSDDDGKKVVKSARDKRFDELRSYVKVMHNGLKIKDWLSIQNGIYPYSCLK
jgi:translation initiation factor 3 subunit C